MENDLYKILQVEPNCSTNDIKKSYYKLAKQYHPDKGGSPEQFQKINYAYNILIDTTSRNNYNSMNSIQKNKFIVFLEKWFTNQDIKSQDKIWKFNFNDIMFQNIESYDFNDILQYFNSNIIPTKTNKETIDCSDSDIDYWDETQAEYYKELPLKYYEYNINNIKLELKCSLDELVKQNIRKIKIKRKFFDSIEQKSFHFNTSHKYIVFNSGGDIDTSNGHLIISLVLPNYSWDNNNIIYDYPISLYQFIYGVNITLDKNILIKENICIDWLPYRDGMYIQIATIGSYIFIIRLNINYIDSEDKKNILYTQFN
jgi:DnaJ-class molecular chaperone